jgi:hypothetical protein
MNLRQGFLRLWIVLSACWVAGFSWVSRDDLALNHTWDMPWALVEGQFKSLPREDFEELSNERRAKYLSQQKDAEAKGLYCPNGTPSDGRPLVAWTEQELRCAITERLPKFGRDA